MVPELQPNENFGYFCTENPTFLIPEPDPTFRYFCTENPKEKPDFFNTRPEPDFFYPTTSLPQLLLLEKKEKQERPRDK